MQVYHTRSDLIYRWFHGGMIYMDNRVGLILDASAGTDTVVVSLVSEELFLGDRQVAFSSNNSGALLPAVVDLLGEHRAALADVAGIVLVSGENRFTVARLTTVIANGIGWSNGVPVVARQVAPELAEFWELVNGTVSAAQIKAQYTKAPTIN